jgi:hypothetical protein
MAKKSISATHSSAASAPSLIRQNKQQEAALDLHCLRGRTVEIREGLFAAAASEKTGERDCRCCFPQSKYGSGMVNTSMQCFFFTEMVVPPRRSQGHFRKTNTACHWKKEFEFLARESEK